MNKITDLPQHVLRQVLNTALTNPNTMTESELTFSKRICSCSLCTHLWVRRKKDFPDKCPACHRRGWNRPMINALIAANAITPSDKKLHPKDPVYTPLEDGA